MTSSRPSAGTWKFSISSIFLVLSGLNYSNNTPKNIWDIIQNTFRDFAIFKKDKELCKKGEQKHPIQTTHACNNGKDIISWSVHKIPYKISLAIFGLDVISIFLDHKFCVWVSFSTISGVQHVHCTKLLCGCCLLSFFLHNFTVYILP